MRGFYSEDLEPPAIDPAKHIRVYLDGARLTAAHNLKAAILKLWSWHYKCR